MTVEKSGFEPSFSDRGNSLEFSEGFNLRENPFWEKPSHSPTCLTPILILKPLALAIPGAILWAISVTKNNKTIVTNFSVWRRLVAKFCQPILVADLLRGDKNILQAAERKRRFSTMEFVFRFNLQEEHHMHQRDHLPRLYCLDVFRFLPEILWIVGKLLFQKLKATLLGEEAIFGGLKTMTFLIIPNGYHHWTDGSERDWDTWFQSRKISECLLKNAPEKSPLQQSLKNNNISEKKILPYYSGRIPGS